MGATRFLAELFFAVAARTTPGATNTSSASSAEMNNLLKAMLSLLVLSSDLAETIIQSGLPLWNLPSTETALNKSNLNKRLALWQSMRFHKALSSKFLCQAQYFWAFLDYSFHSRSKRVYFLKGRVNVRRDA